MAKDIVVRDPVHGDIELTPVQVAVLDTAEVQRLRGIKQLGTAYLVYPGCTHTRFEHSLGTLATARRIVAALRRAGHPVSADDEELIGVAALLHDIAHMPFGHTLEDERKLLPRHDKAERFLPCLREGEVGEVLRDLGLAGAVEGLLVEGHDWRSQIVSSSVDADLLDYLRRDSYYAGISQNYDDRVYRYFCIAGGQLALHLAKRGMDRPDARSEVLHLLRMRYFLTERVYLHHAKVAAGAMISKAVELCLAAGCPLGRLARLTDASLLGWLSGEGSEQPHPAAARLTAAVQRRRLYKRAYGLSGPAIPKRERLSLSQALHGSGNQRRVLEERIAAKVGVPAHQVIVHCTGELPFREVTTLAHTRHGLHPLNAPPGGIEPPTDIQMLEEQYLALWRLWVFAPSEIAASVGRETEAVLGFPSELRALG